MSLRTYLQVPRQPANNTGGFDANSPRFTVVSHRITVVALVLGHVTSFLDPSLDKKFDDPNLTDLLAAVRGLRQLCGPDGVRDRVRILGKFHESLQKTAHMTPTNTSCRGLPGTCRRVFESVGIMRALWSHPMAQASSEEFKANGDSEPVGPVLEYSSTDLEMSCLPSGLGAIAERILTNPKVAAEYDARTMKPVHPNIVRISWTSYGRCRFDDIMILPIKSSVFEASQTGGVQGIDRPLYSYRLIACVRDDADDTNVRVGLAGLDGEDVSVPSILANPFGSEDTIQAGQNFYLVYASVLEPSERRTATNPRFLTIPKTRAPVDATIDSVDSRASNRETFDTSEARRMLGGISRMVEHASNNLGEASQRMEEASRLLMDGDEEGETASGEAYHSHHAGQAEERFRIKRARRARAARKHVPAARRSGPRDRYTRY